jgi:hypothetical protein
MDGDPFATCYATAYFQEVGLDLHIEGWKKVGKLSHHELLGVGIDLAMNMDNANKKMEGCDLIGQMNLEI